MKNAMKHVSAMIGLLLLAVVLVPMQVKAADIDTSAAKQTNAETDFTINEYGMITAYKGTETTVYIPEKIGAVDVKGLSGTFLNHTTVQAVYVPDTMTTIGDKSFSGASSLNTIGYYQLSTPVTKETVVSDNSEKIPDPETANASQFAEVFQQYIKGAVDNTFYKIVGDAGVATFSKNVVLFGNQVFYGSSISCFVMDVENANYSVAGPVGNNKPDGVSGCLLSKDGTVLVSMAPNVRYTDDQTKYILPDGIVEIKPYACSAKDVQEIVVPTSVTTIDDCGFCKAGNLLKITFTAPAKVTTIGSYGFADNPNLDIKLPSSVKKIGSYCFANIVNRTPDISETSIETISEFTFKGCENLHTIVMPKSLLYVESYAFAGTDNLNEVKFTGTTLKKIGDNAFNGCQNLHKIDIPEGVTAIENGTFAGCQNLNEIELPDSLVSIGDNAFANCNNIHKLVIPPNVTHISKTSFSGVTKTNGIDTSKNIYAQAAVSGKKLPKKGAKFTAGSLKYKVTKVTAKSIEVSVIGVKSKKITKITVKSKFKANGFTYTTTSIGNGAFKGCKKLKKVTIGGTVKAIGSKAFYGDKKLNTIIIKSKVLKKVKASAITGIAKNAKIKVPKAKLKAYKRLFKSKTGFKKTMKIVK